MYTFQHIGIEKKYFWAGYSYTWMIQKNFFVSMLGADEPPRIHVVSSIKSLSHGDLNSDGDYNIFMP